MWARVCGERERPNWIYEEAVLVLAFSLTTCVRALSFAFFDFYVVLICINTGARGRERERERATQSGQKQPRREVAAPFEWAFLARSLAFSHLSFHCLAFRSL